MSEYCVSCGAWIQSFDDDQCAACFDHEFVSDEHECDDDCSLIEDDELAP